MRVLFDVGQPRQRIDFGEDRVHVFCWLRRYQLGCLRRRCCGRLPSQHGSSAEQYGCVVAVARARRPGFQLEHGVGGREADGDACGGAASIAAEGVRRTLEVRRADLDAEECTLGLALDLVRFGTDKDQARRRRGHDNARGSRLRCDCTVEHPGITDAHDARDGRSRDEFVIEIDVRLGIPHALDDRTLGGGDQPRQDFAAIGRERELHLIVRRWREHFGDALCQRPRHQRQRVLGARRHPDTGERQEVAVRDCHQDPGRLDDQQAAAGRRGRI